MLPYSGFPALPDKMKDMHKQLIALGLNDVEALTARIKKCEDWVDNVEETELTGNPVEFQNALAVPAKSLITSINATQDLHGLPFPYVGGAYKNKLDSSAVTQGSFDDPSATANCVSDYTPISGGADYYMSGNSGYADGIYLRFYDANKNELDTSTRISKYVVAFGFTAPSTAVYTRIMWYKGGGLTPTDIVNALVQLEIGTTATSYAPYSNICPISGRDSVVVDDVGKNIYSQTNEQGVIYGDGTEATVQNRCRTSGYISIDGNSQYTLKTYNSNAVYPLMALFYDADKNYIGYTTPSSSGYVYSFTSLSNAKFVRFDFNKNNANFTPSEIGNCQLEYGDTATSYVPYAHSSATIQLGTTVYGAEINWDTGVGTVKTALVTLTGASSEAWDLSGNNMRANTQAIKTLVKTPLNNDTIANIKSSAFVAMSANNTYRGTAGAGISVDTGGQLSVCDGKGGMTVAGWTAYLAENPLQVEYELATPTTIQLTPTMLEMLKGYNRVSIEDGTITITAYTGGPWEPITRTIKKVTNKTKTTKKRRK